MRFKRLVESYLKEINESSDFGENEMLAEIEKLKKYTEGLVENDESDKVNVPSSLLKNISVTLLKFITSPVKSYKLFFEYIRHIRKIINNMDENALDPFIALLFEKMTGRKPISKEVSNEKIKKAIDVLFNPELTVEQIKHNKKTIEFLDKIGFQ